MSQDKFLHPAESHVLFYIKFREKVEEAFSLVLARINQSPLDKDNRLVTRDFKAAPASGIRTGEQVIYPDQVIARFGEFGPIGIAGPRGNTLLLRSPQPADMKLC
jgi:hypothetical protein